MKTIDCIYTPTQLALNLISIVERHNDPSIIADFAAGDGRLLRIAQEKWPKSKIVATDINHSNINLLKKRGKNWEVGKCDFLNTDSRQMCEVLTHISGKVSLILLNPPFSCRGGRKVSVSLNNEELTCSVALAFIIISTIFLSENGQIIAILPVGTLYNDKDSGAWKAIKKLYNVQEIAENGHKTFAGWSPKTVVVKISKKKSTDTFIEEINNGVVFKTPKLNIAVSLFRGKVSMHTVIDNNGEAFLPLIHSTELEKNGVNLQKRQVVENSRTIVGPVVLIPRVGRPNPNKIQIYNGKNPITLSDCVIAIKCKRKMDANVIRNYLLKNWSLVEKKYIGTCAPYITLNSLNTVLTELGFQVDE